MHDLPVNSLGPYPLLQLAFAVIVLGAFALAAWRGTRDRRATQRDQFPNEQRWFFDGPVVAALNKLREQNLILEHIEENTKPLAEGQRIQIRILEEIKDIIEDLKDQRRRR